MQPFPSGEHEAGVVHTDTIQLPSHWRFPIGFSQLALHIARSGYVAVEAKVLYSTKLVKSGDSLTGLSCTEQKASRGQPVLSELLIALIK